MFLLRDMLYPKVLYVYVNYAHRAPYKPPLETLTPVEVNPVVRGGGTSEF